MRRLLVSGAALIAGRPSRGRLGPGPGKAGPRCNTFTTTMTLSSKGIWSFRFTATPYGENTTAVCTFEPTSTNASTGRYYADAKVSGL